VTVGELKSVLSELPDNMTVHVIMDGCIDSQPDWNAVDDILYIEGISPAKESEVKNAKF
jgi:hypothetical protein